MAELAAPPPNAYDEVPYESHPYAQTHPDRLAVMATVFGLKPPAVERCRVLELGAAAGGNIIPMAEGLPDAEFLGVDYSARQVADGEQLVRNLGLKNVRLRHANIMDIDDSWGTFDYVIAHGVFSWIPTQVREKLLDVCRRNLNPNGVAYVSYNTYPGWHMRGMIRDMMRFHAMRFGTAPQRTQQARALLDFLAQNVKQEGPYSALLKTELENVQKQADHYLYHEHLEEVNDPVYFHEFVAMARRHGLRYLAEARIATMVAGNFGPEVDKTLKALKTDQIMTEQYMDFIRNRMFRETLLVPEGATPNWTIEPTCLQELHIASGAKPTGTGAPDVRSEESVQYQTRGGLTLTTSRPLLKAAMKVLADRWPGTIPFSELIGAARDLAGNQPAEDDAKNLALGLLNSYISSDLVELHAVPVPAVRAASEKPVVLGSARQRVADGAKVVANRRHEVVRMTDLDLRLVPLLDGTRDREHLSDELTEKALGGDLNVQKDGQKLTQKDDIRPALAAVVDHALNNLAANSLLVG
jgi:methyltransferase-like protein/SAM-dependent methyltransferase